MDKVWIIADDLTGAADTGVKFTREGPVRLVSLLPESPIALDSTLGALAINTETRNADPRDVARVLGSLSEPLKSSKPAVVYKKLDSVLRGQIGLEIATLMDLTGKLGALVAPAYPRFDRITVDGVHLVKGRPVNDTETARDPLRPVLDSRLASVISIGHDISVNELHLSEIAKGPGRIREVLEKRVSKGIKFMVACDARTEEDLSSLAEAGLALKNDLVLAGSAGLAEPLATKLASKSPAPFTPGPPKGPALFFGGSASTSLRAQLTFLADFDQAQLITLDLESLMSGAPMTLPPIDPLRPLIYNLPQPEDPPKWPSRAIVEAFGQFAAHIIGRLSPNTVFLSGGDTAREVLKALGVADMEIRSELSPGVVHLAAGKLSLLTKSGGFGAPGLLSELWRAWLSPAA